jgi:MFS family permease
MFRLLIERNFGALNVAQFVTVFNDNALKQSFLLLTVMKATQGSAAGYEEQAFATILFSVPFLILSGFAGRFTDRFSKRSVVVWAKFSEFLIMLIAAGGFLMNNRWILLVALLLLATQSTFFSPAKYGILPEILPHEKLSAANGLLQTTSYIAILIGTAFAGFMLEYFKEQRVWIGVGLIVLAAMGWLTSMLMDYREPADPDKSLFSGYPLSDELASLTWIVKRRFLLFSILGYAYVWMVGTVLLFNINVYGLDTLNLGGGATSLLIILLSIGLGAGCLSAGLLSGERIEAGLVPLGAFGMGLSLMGFVFQPSTMAGTALTLGVAGFFGGFFLIPLQTLMQELPEADRKGEALGIANVITFLGVIVSSGLYVLAVGWFSMQATHLMVLLGGLTVCSGGIMVYLAPRFLLRFFLFLINATVVRTHVRGHEDIPDKGGVLIEAHGMHPSAPLFVDYAVDRPVHFVGVREEGTSGFLSFLFDLMRTGDVQETPSRDQDELRKLVRSRLSRGQVICVLTNDELAAADGSDPVDEQENEQMHPAVSVEVQGLEESVFGSGTNVPTSVTVRFTRLSNRKDMIEKGNHVENDLDE